jgi:hypothetical protein
LVFDIYIKSGTIDNNNSYYKKAIQFYIKYYSKQGEKIVVLVRILIMSKSGFEDEVPLIKLIVGVVKHVTIDELGPVA